MVLSPAAPAPPGDKCPRTPDGSLAEAAAQCCFVRAVGHGGIVIAALHHWDGPEPDQSIVLTPAAVEDMPV